jgi:hypothetical protein
MGIKAKSRQADDLTKRFLEKLGDVQRAAQVDHGETDEQKQARINRAKKDYRYFVKTYFPHYATEECADFHVKEANAILKDPGYAGCVAWFRGAAKSVHMDIFIPIWLHLFHGQLKNMVLVGANSKAATELLQDVQVELEANPQLSHDFGSLVSIGDWSVGNFYTTTGCKFNALGKGQSPRGIRKGPNRPDYIVCDDLDDDQEILNGAQVDKRVEWIKGGLINSFGVQGRIIMVNNIIGPRTIMTEMMRMPGFKTSKVNVKDDKGNFTWPQRITQDFIDKRIALIGTNKYDSEFMNKPAVEGKIFKSEYIQFKTRLKLNQYERIVCTWDVAYSDSESADTNGISLAGLYGNEKHVLGIFCRHCVIDIPLSWMYELQKRLPPTVTVEFYAESQFMNDSVEIAMQRVAKQYGFRLPIIFLDRPTANKYSRMMTMLPAYQRGEVFYDSAIQNNADTERGLTQLKSIKPGYSAHDDYPDAQAYAFSILEQSQAVGDSEIILGKRDRPTRLW